MKTSVTSIKAVDDIAAGSPLVIFYCDEIIAFKQMVFNLQKKIELIEKFVIEQVEKSTFESEETIKEILILDSMYIDDDFDFSLYETALLVKVLFETSQKNFIFAVPKFK